MSTTRQHFERDLKLLQDEIVHMGVCADAMVTDAIAALISGDMVLIQKVIAADDEVDRLDVDIESKCLHLIMREQPVARDLRILGTALKIIVDIERIADYAVDIAKIGRRLVKAQEPYRPLVDIPGLAQRSQAMLQEALQAFVQHDLALMEKVMRDDDAVDVLYHHIRRDMTHTLLAQPENSLLAVNLIFAAKYLERVSDHVVNIAERVYFIETGKLKPTPTTIEEKEA